MLVQIATFVEAPDELEEGVRHVLGEVVPSIRGANGLKAAYWVVDRENGKRLSIMVWENAEAAAGAMPAVVASVQQRRAEAGLTEPPASPSTVERFEVAAFFESFM